ncbi:MAG: hypothetical protein KAH93_04170 [Candidatus Aenigmarchaeota archaeon]|nr:hypothetical protein [Candidatus Aenigmarchaeota archaeon]
MDDVEVIEAGDETIADEIKKRMKLIDGKLNEIRKIRAEIRELNKKKAKKRPITIRVPADKRDEIKKKIEEIIGEYDG